MVNISIFAAEALALRHWVLSTHNTNFLTQWPLDYLNVILKM